MKNILVLLLCLELVGCATTSLVTSKLSLGMTKEEVIAKCGNPTQGSAIQNKDGRILESFIYREQLYDNAMGIGGIGTSVNTYVYFADGKVIYYGGNPNMPTEQNEEQKK